MTAVLSIVFKALFYTRCTYVGILFFIVFRVISYHSAYICQNAYPQEHFGSFMLQQRHSLSFRNGILSSCMTVLF